MREIKFRAWDKEKKKMLPSFDFNDLANKNYTGFIIGDPFDKKQTAQYFEFKNLEFMQYTGLKEKNGKEIYEGDIIKFYWGLNPTDPTEMIDEVKFVDGCFYGWWKSGNAGRRLDRCNSICEVIGNIYENPELLSE